MTLRQWLRALPLRWRSITRRDAVEQELDDEIRFHLEEEVDGYVRGGMEPDDAWRLARRRFGGIEVSKERCRDARGVGAIETLLQDARYAARILRRDPGYTLTSLLTLALGIGMNTAVFSLTEGILLSPLPYPAPDRLVSVRATYPNGGLAGLREDVRSLDVAAYAEGKPFTLKDGGTPVRITGARVSAELLSVLSAAPALGRTFAAGEDIVPRNRVVILSHALWLSRFGGNPAAVGRFVELDDVPHEVVGVMTPSFQFPSARTQILVPLSLDPSNAVGYWAGDFMPIVGRLRPGASLEQAVADVRLFQSRVRARFPWRMPDDWNRDITIEPLHDAVVGSVRARLWLVTAAVVLVLLVGCANVANLSLSKAASRQREVAIRTALGASPRRVARQLFTESLVLAAAGGALGLILAVATLDTLKALLPPETPRLGDVEVNWRVLVFTATISIAIGAGFGLAPVVNALRLRLRPTLDSGGRGGAPAIAGRLRALLTVTQIACAALLVISAALLGRSLWTLSQSDPGFTSTGVVTARLSPSGTLCATAEGCVAFYRAVVDAAAAAPGIDTAALVNTLPLTGAVAKRSLEIDGFTPPASQPASLFWMHVVTPRYLDVLRIRIASGRGFTDADLAGPRVALVTAATARKFWPGESPLGGRVRYVGDEHWHTIVGVVDDVRAFDLTRDTPEFIAGAIYFPQSRHATLETGEVPAEMTLTLRTALGAEGAEAAIRRVVASVSSDVVISDVRRMDAVLTSALAAPAATTTLLAATAVLALALGCVGVYGVLSFLVSRRTRELGIRFALGARRRDVCWMVIREGATLSLIGIVAGFAGAIGVTRWLASELHGVSATDPLTYAVVGAAMLTVTLAACYVPTRRAMNVDPLVALRGD